MLTLSMLFTRMPRVFSWEVLSNHLLIDCHTLTFNLGYGMESPCGHIDFYPNGGFDQPGCSLFDMPVSLDNMDTARDTMGRHLVACSHNRGIELYIESLRSSQCQLVAHRCDSYEAFEQGRCFDCGLLGQNCAILGERAIEYKPLIATQPPENEEGELKHMKFYLHTGKKSPFCRRHFSLLCKIFLTDLDFQNTTTFWNSTWPSRKPPRPGCRAI